MEASPDLKNIYNEETGQRLMMFHLEEETAVEPHDKTKTGFILEFKTKKDLDDTALKGLAEEGIRQIRDHQYFMDMEYHGIRNITLFGVAFSGKKVSSVKVEKK